MPARHLVPPVLFALIVVAWFFVPSAPVCKLIGVEASNCPSWTSGLFGVGIGGCLTLWASWHFGDKSTADITKKLDTAVNEVIDIGSDTFVKEIKEKLEQATAGLPHKTVQAIQSRTVVTALLASGTLVEKLLPQIAEAICALLPDAQKQRLEAEAKAAQQTTASPDPKLPDASQ